MNACLIEEVVCLAFILFLETVKVRIQWAILFAFLALSNWLLNCGFLLRYKKLLGSAPYLYMGGGNLWFYFTLPTFHLMNCQNIQSVIHSLFRVLDNWRATIPFFSISFLLVMTICFSVSTPKK
ncbi:hypothetical protein ACJX0J_015971, partial [Zea mays]